MEIKHRKFPRALSFFSKLGLRVWRLFSSLQLAVILVLALSAFGLASILVIQAPSGIAAGSREYALWIENVARMRFGDLTGFMAFLRLFDVTHSPLFIFTGILLAVNIIICSVNRWKARMGALSGGQVRRPFKFYQAGIYFIHLSIIILIAGFLAGNYFGFRNPSFIVSEGMTREVGYGTNLSLRLESFEDEYWADGTPRDYRSRVVIYEGGSEVKRGLIRVNEPLACRDVRFYQSSFGPAASIEVRGDGSRQLYSGSVALPMQMKDGPSPYPMGIINIPDAGLIIYVVGSELDNPGRGNSRIDLGISRDNAGSIKWISLGRGEYRDFEGLKLGFTGTGQYSGFQVSRDPGINLIWTGSCLFLLGLGMAFFFRDRRLSAVLRREGDGRYTILIKPAASKDPGADSELQEITGALHRQQEDS